MGRPNTGIIRTAMALPVAKMGLIVNLAEQTVSGFGGIVTRIHTADAHSSSRRRRRFEKLDRPLDRLPGEMASGQVPRIKSCLAQGCRRLASDVKPVDAKRDDRRA